MIKLLGLTGVHLFGVLTVIPASVIGTGVFVVSSLAAPANPAPAIGTSPANPSTSASATFTFTSTKTPTGYLCALDTLTYRSCSSPATYSGLKDGSHKFSVEARYSSGTSHPANVTWKIIPAVPVVTSGPANGSSSPDSSPAFTFSDTTPDVTFTCWVDAKRHNACGGNRDGAHGSRTFSGLGRGGHCLNVFAEDASGYKSPTLQNYCWTIVAPQGFAVGGDLITPLFPGTSQPLDLTFTNPNSAPVTIPANGITTANITITSTAPGCASSNFAVKQSLTAAVTIPASQATPVSLSDLHVPQTAWPVIAMLETNTNQDACQGAHLTLTYSGIEASG